MCRSTARWSSSRRRSQYRSSAGRALRVIRTDRASDHDRPHLGPALRHRTAAHRGRPGLRRDRRSTLIWSRSAATRRSEHSGSQYEAARAFLARLARTPAGGAGQPRHPAVQSDRARTASADGLSRVHRQRHRAVVCRRPARGGDDQHRTTLSVEGRNGLDGTDPSHGSGRSTTAEKTGVPSGDDAPPVPTCRRSSRCTTRWATRRPPSAAMSQRQGRRGAHGAHARRVRGAGRSRIRSPASGRAVTGRHGDIQTAGAASPTATTS